MHYICLIKEIQKFNQVCDISWRELVSTITKRQKLQRGTFCFARDLRLKKNKLQQTADTQTEVVQNLSSLCFL